MRLLLPFLLIFVIQSFGQSFQNSSFEVWGNQNYCDTNKTPDGWLNYSNGGIASDECNFNFCPTTIPTSASHGFAYARSVAFGPGGEGEYQLVSGFMVGNSYTITFDYSGS